jgi:hypothetical protein
MFELLPDSQGRFLAIKASGKLTDRDYKDFLPVVEAIIDRHGPVRALFDLTEFEGWTAQAAWDDFTFGLRHRRNFERIALVGDQRWEPLAARMANALLPCEVRHFAAANRQIAWDYILDLE